MDYYSHEVNNLIQSGPENVCVHLPIKHFFESPFLPVKEKKNYNENVTLIMWCDVMTPEIEILRKSNNHEIKAEMKSHETKSHKYVFKRGNDDITVYFFKSNQIK